MDTWNWDLIVAVVSLIAAVTSAIIAGVSLHFMIKINRIASEFTKKQANKQNKYNRKQLKEIIKLRKVFEGSKKEKKKPKKQKTKKIEDIIVKDEKDKK